MAVQIQRYDDLDGTEGAETITFALDGKNYEIDLSDDNAAAFRAMFSPYLRVARTAPTQDNRGGLFYLPARLDHSTGTITLAEEPPSPAVATATGGGEALFTDSDPSTRPLLALAPDTHETPPTPHPTPPTDKRSAARTAKETTPPAAETAPSIAPAAPAVRDSEVREWARRWGVPGCPTRGRMPVAIREIYNDFHDGKTGPWKSYLEERGVDPAEAEAKARALIAVDSTKQAGPTDEEMLSKKAHQVGKLNGAQLSRLRLMFNAKKGRAVAHRKNADFPSYDALKNRGCCILLSSNEKRGTRTYEITEVGRKWFEVRGVDPAVADD